MAETPMQQIERLIGEVQDLSAKIPDLVLRKEVERKERAITASIKRIRRLTASVLVLTVAFFVLGGTGVLNARHQSESTKAEGVRSRRVLCDYLNRYGEGARLDRQALIVFSTRPGVDPTPEQKAIIEAYLSFGLAAYPKLDCAAVSAGASVPALPPLPERPTVPAD